MEGVDYFFGFDIEGSGESHKDNFIVALGAVLIDAHTGEILVGFLIYFQNIGKWQSSCVNNFWKKHPMMYKITLHTMKTSGETPESGMKEFKKFLKFINIKIS